MGPRVGLDVCEPESCPPLWLKEENKSCVEVKILATFVVCVDWHDPANGGEFGRFVRRVPF